MRLLDASMADQVRIFINEKAVFVASGTTVQAAVQAFDESLGAALTKGTGYVTDGVGRRFLPEAVVKEGMIVRAIPSRPPAD